MPIVKKINKNKKQWFLLKNPVKIHTDDGIKECTKFYFNGFKQVFELLFSDDNKYSFTSNHKIKNSNSEWVSISEIDTGFVANNDLKLVSKKYIGVMPTMDMEVPDVHYYVLNNGIHSHNSSFILGQVSPSIEPLNSNYFIKDLEKGKFTYKNPYLEKLLIKYNKNDRETWHSILLMGGSVQHLEFLSDEEKDVFKTFGEISQKEIIIQAAQRQKYIDQSQSLNLMIHPSTSPKDVSQLLIDGWKMGIKTFYYQRGTNAAQELGRSLLSCKSCEA